MYLATRQMEDRLWWYRGMRRISERLLDRYVGTGPLDILDAGCGTGGAMVWLSRRGRVVGVDLSELALAFCRERRLQRLARASITQLPFAPETFDLVACLDVLYHLWVEDRAALREFARVLRPGGFLLVRVAAIDWLRGEHDHAGFTRQRYSLGELRAKLEAAGLEVLAASYANALLFPVAAAKRALDGLGGGAARARGRGREAGAAETPRSAPPGQGDGRGLTLAGDFWLPPAPLNAALERLLGLEAELVARSALPMGLSAVALARRP